MKKKRKVVVQVVNDPNTLEALIRCMKRQILDQEEEIVRLRRCVVTNEALISAIKQTGEYTQRIESNIQ